MREPNFSPRRVLLHPVVGTASRGGETITPRLTLLFWLISAIADITVRCDSARVVLTSMTAQLLPPTDGECKPLWLLKNSFYRVSTTKFVTTTITIVDLA